VVFVLWTALGAAVYLGYGRRHSTVAAMTDDEYAEASASSTTDAPASADTRTPAHETVKDDQ
jgi:basic amino acid/polyamine antiporter, APA family